MIDTHSHLDFSEFDQDREEVISRFFEQGPADAKALAGKGKAIINVGVDLERSRKSVEIAASHKKVFASVGLHPEYFANYELGSMNYDKDFENLKILAKHRKVVAIGETGLDYYHVTRSTKHETQELENIKIFQKKGFLAQIELAQEMNLPVIVHCREAWDDMYEVMKSQYRNPNVKQNPKSQIPTDKMIQNTEYKIQNPRFVLHCYTGEKKDTEKFLALPDVLFSFSGNITYPKPTARAEKLAEAVRMVPLERMMLDSDAPYLAPQLFRGKRNEPAYVKYIAERIAEIKGISASEVEKETDRNAENFFNI